MNSFVSEERRQLAQAPQVPLGWSAPGRAHGGLLDEERATLHAGAWFGELPGALRVSILGSAHVRVVEAGSVLARRGDKPSAWVGVVRGALRLGTSLPDGREFTLDFVGPGQWFGDIALIDERPLELDVVAHTAAKLLFLSRPDMHRLVEAHGEFQTGLLKLNCQRLRHMFRRFEEVQTLPLAQRLACQLQRLAHQFGRPFADGVCIGLNLSQTDLAALVGASRQRVNRTLRQMHLEGIVRLGESRLQVCSGSQLAAIAEGRRVLA